MSMGEDYVAAMNPTSHTNGVLFFTNMEIGITIMTRVEIVYRRYRRDFSAPVNFSNVAGANKNYNKITILLNNFKRIYKNFYLLN